MAITDTGHLIFEDDYTQKYEVKWETKNGVIDITTITQQPYMWGLPAEVKIENGILYRKGIITVHRQAIQKLPDGYVIIAEGATQFYDYIKMNYLCEPIPEDVFKYHLDSIISDRVNVKIAAGSRWSDPDDPDDDIMVWGDINPDGTIATIPSNLTALSWIDVFI